MLDKQQKEDLRNRLVSLILEVRRQYLAEGANSLKHWDQLQGALKSAGRQAETVEQWYSTLARKVRLGPPSSSLSSDVVALREYVDGLGAEARTEFLRMAMDELPLLVALARSAADARREARDDAATRETVDQAQADAPRKKKGKR